jgi:hypothetical protein
VKKILGQLLPHFDKAETLYKVATVLYKVAMLIRDELHSLTGDKNPPAAPGLAS